jgi:peptide/nickel transport system permease protein
MLTYLARRLAAMAFVLFAVLTVTFALLSLMPGDIAIYYAGPHASPLVIAETRHILGLDQPKIVQYARYLWLALHGDLGQSATLEEPVLLAIGQRLPATALLAGAVVAIELSLALVLGSLAALHERGLVDRLLALLAALGTSLPTFWLGIVLLFLVAFKLNLLPLGGYGDPLIAYLILPAVTLGVPGAFWYARVLRAGLVGVLREDYVRTARSKGLARRAVMLRHALPNALIPVVTFAAMDLGGLLGGVVVVEAIFAWPGIGLQAYHALQALDLPLVLGTVLFSAFCIVVLNLVADLLRVAIDPRVRLQ